jgi:hypothetical protein
MWALTIFISCTALYSVDTVRRPCNRMMPFTKGEQAVPKIKSVSRTSTPNAHFSPTDFNSVRQTVQYFVTRGIFRTMSYWSPPPLPINLQAEGQVPVGYPRLRSPANTPVNVWAPQKAGNLSSSWAIISFSRRTLLHGVTEAKQVHDLLTRLTVRRHNALKRQLVLFAYSPVVGHWPYT